MARELLWVVVLTFGVVALLLVLVLYDPGAPLADAIERERADVVVRVDYTPGSFIDPPLLTVHLRPGISRGQAILLACDYIEPLLASHRRVEYEIKGLDEWRCPGRT